MDFDTEDVKDFDMDFEVVPMSMRMNEMKPGVIPLYCGMMSPYCNMEGYVPNMFRSTYGMMQSPYGIYDDLPEHDSWGMRMMDEDDEYEEYRDEHIENEFYRDHDGEVKRILSKMEKYNEGVFEYMRNCGIGYEDAKRIVERNIELAIMYYEE